jgi:hypothetical protein
MRCVVVGSFSSKDKIGVGYSVPQFTEFYRMAKIYGRKFRLIGCKCSLKMVHKML